MDSPDLDPSQLACPVPQESSDTVRMAHGGGGRLMWHLIQDVFLPGFRRQGETGRDPLSDPPHDSAVIRTGDGTRLAFTTDSFVVRPLFFPGGDIGSLAVYGTVNDLAMAGAKPLWLSAAFIIEEGFPLDALKAVVNSMRSAADAAAVRIITGDTKVVDRGKGDGVFITTTGIGLIPEDVDISPARIQVGDKILLSGDVGRHGTAILSVRENLQFEGALPSDCAPLNGLVRAMAKQAPQALHCLRDLTRGGLATALCELARESGTGIVVEETQIPVQPSVAAACELLGLDPLYVANEGRMIAIVSRDAADSLLKIMQAHPAAADPRIIGEVTAASPGVVELRNAFGGSRVLDFLSGEQMPRIC